ncbi:MAG: hypothetical protein L3J42_07295, partial [Hydrogenimonas sp.]|nr:hypothetical protein [Hydrogenimonas sp.]
AVNSREERYAKLELFYRTSKEREKIMEALKGLSYRKECSVEISDIVENEGRGIVTIEFHDDYDKEAGEFFDKLIKRLGIERCR